MTTRLRCFIFFVFFLVYFFKFHQHDYEITFTWAERGTFNKTVFKKFDLVTFKYNRSHPVANITYEMNMEIDAHQTLARIQAYKFLSNEYRVFPLRFQVNLCNAVAQNIIGSRDVLYKCGNVTECSFKKGKVYHVCNAYPLEARFPPFMPNGEYKVEVTVINNNFEILVLNGYGKVSRRIKV